MNIKFLNFLNIFKKENYLKRLVDESIETMRQQTNRPYDKDKEEFFQIYFEWKKKYCICSNPCAGYDDPLYEKLKNMGRRALLAIYELTTKHDILLGELLENIYDCKSPELEIHSFEDVEEDYNKVRRFWLDKLEADKVNFL